MSLYLASFEFKQMGWLTLILPVLIIIVMRRGRGAEAAISFPNLSVLVSLGKRVNHTASGVSLPLTFIALVSCILAMARPVWRTETYNRKASGIDIVISLDVSLSMDINDFVRDGQKVRRIDVAKMVVDDFISRRPDDRMGLVVFAGRPRYASPITLDHKWLRGALERVKLNDRFNRGSVREAGTAIGSAISASATRLDSRESKSKIIVLITDGASNSGKISPIEAAKFASTLGIKIYTIAIGTTEGRVDPSIMTYPYQEFDLPTLREIASLTGGEHYWAQDLDSLKQTFKTIDQLEKTEAKSMTVINDRELFMWPLTLALICALAAGIHHAFNPVPEP